jgi:hypothetical protein
MVTTHLRVHAKNLFACFSYNLFNLVTVRKNQMVSDRSFKKKGLFGEGTLNCRINFDVFCGVILLNWLDKKMRDFRYPQR